MSVGHRLLSVAPVSFLIGVSYLERQSNKEAATAQAVLILCLVFVSVVISQSCARYVARHRSPGWSQPKLTISNAVLLSVVLGIALYRSNEVLQHAIHIGLCILVGVLILLIQRLYVFGLKKADPFISAMTLCTMVPLSLGMEILFERRLVGTAEVALAVGYVMSTAINVKLTE